MTLQDKWIRAAEITAKEYRTTGHKLDGSNCEYCIIAKKCRSKNKRFKTASLEISPFVAFCNWCILRYITQQDYKSCMSHYTSPRYLAILTKENRWLNEKRAIFHEKLATALKALDLKDFHMKYKLTTVRDIVKKIDLFVSELQ